VAPLSRATTPPRVQPLDRAIVGERSGKDMVLAVYKKDDPKTVALIPERRPRPGTTRRREPSSRARSRGRSRSSLEIGDDFVCRFVCRRENVTLTPLDVLV